MHKISKKLWHLDLNRQHPLKPQIENHIQDLISSGVLAPGEQVCSCKELALINSISKNTVNKAYLNLQEENVLESYYRRGTYVTELVLQDMEEHYSVPAPFSFYDSRVSGPVLPAGYFPCLHLGSDAPDPSAGDMKPYLDAYKDALALSARKASLCSRFSDGIYSSIASLLRTRNIQVQASHIAVLHGLGNSLRMVVSLLVKPGDGVVMASPADTPALFAFTGVHASLHFTGVDSGGMITEQLELFCQSGAVKVVYLRSAAEYPVMTMLSETRRLHLLQLARKYHLVVIEMDEDYEFAYKKLLPSLVSRNHDGRVIHISPISRITHRMHNIGVVTGPWDFIATLKRSVVLAGDYRDFILERVATKIINDRSIFHIAAEMHTYYRKRMEQVPYLIDSYLKDYISYQLPSAGLSVGLHFNEPANLTPVLQNLEELGCYDPAINGPVAEDQLFSDVRIGIANMDLKTFEAALRLIRMAISCQLSGISNQLSAVS